MSRVALLDVNLLVALFDADHVHHDLAHDWFADQRRAGWATCAVTENGFVRVLSNPGYGAAPNRPLDVIQRLRQFCASGDHAYWTDAVSLREEKVFNAALIRGHQQVTDIYLLGLAAKMKGTLATFDRTIPLAAVRSASRDALTIISSAA